MLYDLHLNLIINVIDEQEFWDPLNFNCKSICQKKFYFFFQNQYIKYNLFYFYEHLIYFFY